MPTRMRLALVVGLLVGAASPAAPATQRAGVVAGSDALPPAAGAYRGARAHLFLEGHARGACGSHGGFSASVTPPSRQGASVVVEYDATFIGELTLEPPLVPRRAAYSIKERARMAERITLSETRGATRVFDTQMTALDIRGRSLPGGAMFRISPSARSTGRATITALPRGQFQIESAYDIWLEITLDGGKTWHRAQEAVRMEVRAR